jgi:hypothetical protein
VQRQGDSKCGRSCDHDNIEGRFAALPQAVRPDLPSHAPHGNLVCGVEVERLKEVRRFAAAKPRR